MSIMRFADPILPTWYTDSDGNKISKIVRNETITVIENRAPLNGLPDEFHRVRIDGMVEIDINSEIKDKKQFKVDYAQTGNVFFHSSLNGSDVLVNEYASRGVSYYPASRIYYETDDLGNVTITMAEAIDLVKDIDEITAIVRKMEEDIRELDESISGNMEDGSKLARDLEEKIKQGNLSNKELSSTILKADKIKDDLDEIYTNTESMKSEASKMIEKLDKLKDDSEGLIVRGESIVEYLELNLDKANNINESLKTLIPKGDTLEKSLKDLIAQAQIKNDELQATINKSVEANTNLTVKIKEANDLVALINPLLTELAQVVESADIVLNLLREQTTISNKTYEDLKIAIKDGNEIIDKIEGIIGGTDFEEVIKRLDAVEKKIIASESQPGTPNLYDIWIRV